MDIKVFENELAVFEYELAEVTSLMTSEQISEAIEQLKEDGTLEKLAQEYFGYSLFDYIPEGYQIGDAL